MKRVNTIDGVVLDYPLFISSEFDVNNHIGTRSVAIDGSSVMFIQPRGALSKEVQIYSGDNGWVSEAVKEQLMLKVDNEVIIVEFSDSSTETYYFDHTATPLSFTPLYEGAEWYSVQMNLLKG